MLSDKAIVVIGLGNLMRGDDAIGRLATQTLAFKRLYDIRLIEIEGDVTQLLEALAGATDAIVIDACKSGAPAGTIHRFDVVESPIPAVIQAVSSHGFGLAAALEMARTFQQLPSQCIVFAVEGFDFNHGAPLSAQVAAQKDSLLASVEREIDRMRRAQDS